jgi:ABC-type branched-subunit amino acid transport system substrate-binding protein
VTRRLARRVATTVVVVLAGCGTRLPETAFTTSTGPTDEHAGRPPASSTTTADATSTDVGVSASTIKLGLVVSKTSPLGSETFSPPMYGAQAFVGALNASGGINGRHVDLVVCDDGATGAGNRRCVTKLIDDEKVFAFVSNAIYDYAGASFVNDRGVPDVGGQPIGNAYEQYHHLWSIYGSSSPRDGTIGVGGKLYGGTEVYRYFAQTLGVTVAGVVAYNQADSLRFANLTAKALELEGYSVVREQLDFAVPSWDASAIDMKSRGVDIVFDALDSAGNVSLCKAMDAAGLSVKAKAVTVQAWNETVRTDYRSSPACRSSLYATATTRNYMDTEQATIARFRTEMRSAFPERETKLSMWALEGWAGAQWLSDAMTSCGAQLTRACVESYLSRPVSYDGRGILTPRDFVTRTAPEDHGSNCLFAAHWTDAAYDGDGGWVTTTPGKEAVCFDVPNIAYAP